MQFTDEEAVVLKRLVAQWAGEGFTVPPYGDTLRGIFVKLGITADTEEATVESGIELGHRVAYDVLKK